MPFEDGLKRYDKNGDGLVGRDEVGGSADPMDRMLRPEYVPDDAFDGNRDGKLNAAEWGVFRAMLASENGLIAIRMGGTGDMTEQAVRWKYQRPVPQVPSTLLYRDVLFMVNDSGTLISFDPATGAVLKQGRLKGAIDKLLRLAHRRGRQSVADQRRTARCRWSPPRRCGRSSPSTRSTMRCSRRRCRRTASCSSARAARSTPSARDEQRPRHPVRGALTVPAGNRVSRRYRSKPFKSFGRPRRLELQAAAVLGMLKRQAVHMQRLTREIDRPQLLGPTDVARLPHQRVHAAALAAGFDCACPSAAALRAATRPRTLFQHLVVADGFLGARVVRVRGLLDAGGLVPHQMIAPYAGRRIRVAVLTAR